MQGHEELDSGSFRSTLIRRTNDLLGENYFQNCMFSPDGLCILTNSVLDNRLRLYNTKTNTATSWSKPDLQVKLCDTVRDFAWYPDMDSSIPSTCCFMAASRDQPVHLIDAYSGRIRANYRPINALDELEAPTCLLFSTSRQSFYCAGFRSDRFIADFDINKPGCSATVLRLGKTRRSKDGQKGLISALAESPASTGGHLLAIGTYSPGSIYVYDVRARIESGAILSGKCLVGHGGRWHNRRNDEHGDERNWLSHAKTKWFQSKTQNGVTRLQFSDLEPHLLWSISRRSNVVIAWDLRMWQASTSLEVCTGSTNQRIGFDLDNASNQLVVGGIDGQLRVYDTKTSQLEHRIVVDAAHRQVLNGVSLSTIDNHRYVAIACGSRQFPSVEELEYDELEELDNPGSILLYEISKASKIVHSETIEVCDS